MDKSAVVTFCEFARGSRCSRMHMTLFCFTIYAFVGQSVCSLWVVTIWEMNYFYIYNPAVSNFQPGCAESNI